MVDGPKSCRSLAHLPNQISLVLQSVISRTEQRHRSSGTAFPPQGARCRLPQLRRQNRCQALCTIQGQQLDSSENGQSGQTSKPRRHQLRGDGNLSAARRDLVGLRLLQCVCHDKSYTVPIPGAAVFMKRSFLCLGMFAPRCSHGRKVQHVFVSFGSCPPVVRIEKAYSKFVNLMKKGRLSERSILEVKGDI